MSSHNRFEFPGLAELRDALRKLPEALTGEASHIVNGAANQAVAQIKRNYAFVSGNIVEGVSAEFARDRFAAGAKVKSASKHAFIYENGTQARHYITTRGNIHETGIMKPAPPGKAFIPVLIRERRSMYEKFRELLERNGLTVTGSVDSHG